MSKPNHEALRAFIKVFLVLAILPALVAWDNPLLSNRQKGDLDFKAGDYSSAIAHFEKAVEREGNDWKLLYDLGTAYYHDGEWSKAIEKLTYAAKIAETEKVENIDRAHIHHNLGLAYLQADDCENAVSSLEQAAGLAPDDKDIAGNLSFAQGYCSGKNKEAPKTEGEQKNKGEGDQKDNQKGQAGKGQSNDQEKVQSSASEGGDKQQNSQGQGNDKNKQQQGKSGGEDKSQNRQGGKEADQGQKAQTGEGGKQKEETDVASDENASKGQGKDQEQPSSKGSNSNKVAQGGNGNGPDQNNNNVPNDGLNLSNAQIQEILKYMSQLEHDSAARYFHNAPQEGDYLDEETMMDMIRRLFLGLPIDRKNPEPADGIDW